MRLQPWTIEELSGYVQTRLQEVGIHANPFDASALPLLLQAANGSPRLVNHLAQRAWEEAAAQTSRATPSASVGGFALPLFIVDFGKCIVNRRRTPAASGRPW